MEGAGWGGTRDTANTRTMYMAGSTPGVVMQYCYVHDGGSYWVDINKPGDRTLIERCYFKNGGSGNAAFHSVGIWIHGQSDSMDAVIRYNVLENFMAAGGTGYITLGSGTGSSGYSIYGNVFLSSDDLEGPSR